MMASAQDHSRLYLELGAMLADVPDLSKPSVLQTQIWLARLYAIIREAQVDILAAAELKSAIDNLEIDLLASPTRVLSIAYRTLAVLERKVPAVGQSAFIPVGGTFEGLVKIGNVITSAKKSVLLVDAYAAANILSDYATHAALGVTIEVLGGDTKVKPDLSGAVKAWRSQYAQTRPLDVRLAPGGALHDRAIFIDDSEAWTLGTSFNSVAKRAPTLLQRVDPTEVFPDKLAAYRSIWATAKQLP